MVFELALVKLFSVILFSNYAFMIISTALFGFGLSGVFSTIFPKLREKYLCTNGLVLFSFLFSVSAISAFFVINTVPLHLGEINRPVQMMYLALYYLSLMVPFFFSGMAIVTVFSLHAKKIGTLYFFDLTGAALACLLIIPLFKYFGAAAMFVVVLGLGIFSALLFNDFRSKRILVAGTMALLAIAFALPAMKTFAIKVHDFKRTYKVDLESGNIEYSRWSALSKIDIALAPEVGWKRLWIDGGTNESALMEFDGHYGSHRVNLLNKLSIAIPHRIKTNADVAIIGSSGGREVLIALNNRPHSVDAIEMDPTIAEIVTQTYGDYIGGIFNDPRVNFVCDEGRSYIKRSRKQYDIIQQVNNFTPIAMASGAINVSESYLLTLDAFEDYWKHLKPDGMIVFNRHNSFKIAVMAQEFLYGKNLDPSRHLVVIEAEDRLNNSLYIKKSAFTPEELRQISDFSRESNCSVLYSQEMQDESNWYVQLLHKKEVKKFLALTGVNLEVPTDNRPFFEHIERWGKIDTSDPRIPRDLLWIDGVKKLGNRISTADLTFVVLLIEASLLSILFIFVPLWVQKKNQLRTDVRTVYSLLGYFFSIGLAFILIEICLIQKFVLFLGVPIYSISAVIFSLLFWSGLGSYFTQRSRSVSRFPSYVLTITLALALLYAGAIFFLSDVLNAFLARDLWLRFIVTSLLIAPAGFLMGMLFPFGVRLVDEHAPELIPWVWGMNAYATVIGSIVSVMIAIYHGFTAVFILAACTYVLGAVGLKSGFSRSGNAVP